MTNRSVTREKLLEACKSVLPISGLVLFLCLFFVPVNSGLMLAFLIGSVMIIVGMALFTIGSDISMSQIGSHIGSKLTKSRKLWLILLLSFVLGMAITVAEPDLQVLATNTPTIDKTVLIIAVSAGVGFFLMIGMLRIFFRIPLKWLLVVFYVGIFVIASFADPDFLSVAFDSGGVTTGPMTVPFIMALGVGVASIRSDEQAKADSFGLVALCSIGPIIAVLTLGFFFGGSSTSSSTILVPAFEISTTLGIGFLKAFPDYMKEVALALLPIFVFFLLFQVISLKLKKKALLRIVIGVLYTYVGLTLFLTGVNVGFSSLGFCLGEELVAGPFKWMIIPLGMLMGWFIINAEPAVHVLNKQVNELSAGAISEKTMGLTLSIGIAAAMGFSMIRVLTGISILWFVVPGYLIAIMLAFVVSPTFTAIAFDAGGVASGPLTATFMLPFAMGVCEANGGNVATDAFGLVAMVAMMPLISVQTMGAISMIKQKKARRVAATFDRFDNNDVIELWEVE